MASRKGLRILLVVSSLVVVLLAILLVARKSGLLYAETRAQRHLRVASVTLAVDPAPETNRRRMAAMVEAIEREHPDVELILF